jgi:hypothetical protein
MPWLLTENSMAASSSPSATRGVNGHSRAWRAVRDVFIDKVANSRDELVLVAPHPQVRSSSPNNGDVTPFRYETGPIASLGDDACNLNQVRPRQRVGALQSGQINQLTNELAEAGALALHALGEARDGLRIVGGILHRFRQQRQRSHRCLQLMGHVRDEVAPHGLEPVRFRDVLQQQSHRLDARRLRLIA